MVARGQRELARRNRREVVEKVPAGPREENPVELDTEEQDIFWDQFPLRIRIPGARGRGGPPVAEVPAAIDLEMWLNIWNMNMVNAKPPVPTAILLAEHFSNS